MFNSLYLYNIFIQQLISKKFQNKTKAKPTSNGNPCKIPWYQGENEYYHCNPSLCMPDQPFDNSTSTCNTGMLFKVNYYYSLTMYSIENKCI